MEELLKELAKVIQKHANANSNYLKLLETYYKLAHNKEIPSQQEMTSFIQAKKEELEKIVNCNNKPLVSQRKNNLV